MLAAPLREWQFRDPRFGTQRRVGIVAQDAPPIAQTVHPETGETGYDGTTYNGLLLGLVQRQQRQLADQRGQITALTDRLARLETAVARIGGPDVTP